MEPLPQEVPPACLALPGLLSLAGRQAWLMVLGVELPLPAAWSSPGGARDLTGDDLWQQWVVGVNCAGQQRTCRAADDQVQASCLRSPPALQPLPPVAVVSV